jgi:sugar phosphate isomerase/epimerase
MRSRRGFLAGAAAALGVSALEPRFSLAAAAERPEIQTGLGGPVGLQLWSLREHLPKDLPGTLAKVRGMGFRSVEGAGLWGHSVADLKDALDKAGLSCTSAHMGMERLEGDLAGAFAEARSLGATDVVCPWIPHDKDFTRDHALRAAEAFNRFGTAAREAGLTFAYHCHGYEFVPATGGALAPADATTLFDVLAEAADASLVAFQIDTFHAYHGGADPAGLIRRHGARVRSLHLKDEKRGFPVKAGSSGAPPEADVPVGTGQIDFPAVLGAAVKAGVKRYYVEDESADPLGHIPKSVAYLEGLKL